MNSNVTTSLISNDAGNNLLRSVERSASLLQAYGYQCDATTLSKLVTHDNGSFVVCAITLLGLHEIRSPKSVTTLRELFATARQHKNASVRATAEKVQNAVVLHKDHFDPAELSRATQALLRPPTLPARASRARVPSSFSTMMPIAPKLTDSGSFVHLSARTQFGLTGTIQFKATISPSVFEGFVKKHGGSINEPREKRHTMRLYEFSGTAYQGKAWFLSESSARGTRHEIILATCDCGIPEQRRCNLR